MNKTITGLSHGTALIVATIVGGGLFALPLALEGVWFTKGVMILLTAGFFMLLTGLMLVDVNLRFPAGTSFHRFTHELLGARFSVVVDISFIFVLYLVTYAYISGAASAFSDAVSQVPGIDGRAGAVLLVTLFISLVIYHGGALASYIISFFVAGKFVTFLLATGGLTGNIKLIYLSNNPALPDFSSLILIIPVCVVAFGFHSSIPSLIKIYGTERPKQIVMSLCLGVLLSAGIYIYWLSITMGVVDKSLFQQIRSLGGNIDALLRVIEGNKPAATVELLLIFFAGFAVLSSLLSASLGLCDYFRDLFKTRYGVKNASLPVLLTYVPPAIFCLFKPDGFLAAISYAGISLVIWAVLLPPLLLIRAREMGKTAVWNFPLGNNVLRVFLVLGVVLWLFMAGQAVFF